MAISQAKQPYFGFKGNKLIFWITLACATDMTLFGYDQGVFSGVVISQDYLDVHELRGPENTNMLSIITSIYTIGCFLGAVAALLVGERYGRTKTILIGTAIMTVGAILQTTSYSKPHMIVARIVSGIGNGINTATAPVWQTETSKVHSRGKLVLLEMGLNIFGLSLSNWVNYGMSYTQGSVVWRFPVALQLVFCIILFCTVPWLPESPRWLLAHGRETEATSILADLDDLPVDDPHIAAKKNEILFSIEYERKNASNWGDLLRGRTGAGTKTIRRLILGSGTQAIQQFGGINIMSYYLPTVLIESVNLEESMARLIAACASVVYLAAALAAAPLVERLGRRMMMMVSTGIQLFCFLLITILLSLSEKPGYAHQVEVAEASIVWFFVYYIGFGLGMLGIPWLYPTEINSLPMRTKGAALATMTNWITNFIVVEVTPIGIQNLSWRFYIIWVVTNALFLPLIWLFYPETANRTLEDLDAYYRDDPPLLLFRDRDSTSLRRPAKFADAQDRDVEEATENMRRRSIFVDESKDQSSD
ncbi:general substrate transporter [Durotheca rogersii]|uniref:general substrate transporter n=1 Tax=Durotheca rogersii TaxID=419775 RepID=UPI00221F0890|nr:general substrate transporter [Durotheca rogersii]KAI5865122.1 general substrate transporter [Durotheca rogersii]